MDKKVEQDEIQLRHIRYGELHLMMTRLVIDVTEHPEYYGPDKDGVTEFIRGENFRRELFTNER